MTRERPKDSVTLVKVEARPSKEVARRFRADAVQLGERIAAAQDAVVFIPVDPKPDKRTAMRLGPRVRRILGKPWYAIAWAHVRYWHYEARLRLRALRLRLRSWLAP